MPKHLPLAAILALLGTVTACQRTPDTGTPEADTDTDADTDADVEASLDGEITYVLTDLGKPICDSVISLAGTPYTGNCSGCDFSFSVDAVETVDHGTGACTIDPILTFLQGESGYDWYSNPILAFWEYYSFTWQDFIANGFYYLGFGPYWYTCMYDGLETAYGQGSADFDGTRLTWSWSMDYIAYDLSHPAYYADCGTLETSGSEQDHGGKWTVGGTLGIGSPRTIDVWSLDVDTTDTDRFAVSVDTVDGTAAHLLLRLNDPAGCSVVSAVDNFECTWPPPQAASGCPSALVDGADPGAWQAVVTWSGVEGDAVGDHANYQVTVDTPYDPRLTLVADEVDCYPVLADVSLEVAASATVVLPE